MLAFTTKHPSKYNQLNPFDEPSGDVTLVSALQRMGGGQDPLAAEPQLLRLLESRSVHALRAHLTVLFSCNC